MYVSSSVLFQLKTFLGKNNNNMTADTESNCSNNSEDATGSSNINNSLPTEIMQIFEYLSGNEKIIFKSQQIDDPELQRSEKVQIAKEIYERNRQTFLMRFGIYMEETHLQQFANLAIADTNAPLKNDENSEEMKLMLRDFQRKLNTHKLDVKNRRYTAMQQLIKKGEYFSELEMMRRAPELYQELIGQYLSEAEKKQRDSYDVKNTTFSGILMHTMQQQQMKDVLEKVAEQNEDLCIEETNSNPAQLITTTHNGEEDIEEEEEVEEEEHDSEKPKTSIISSSDQFDVPVAFRQQWGNFDDEHIACSTSHVSIAHHESITNNKQQAKCNEKPGKIVIKKNRNNKFITAGERDLLQQEFVGIMHEKFLAGLDEDFDYTAVDDNSELDDIWQLNQDKEDAYFEESDDDSDETTINRGVANDHEQDESDDDLDIYMKHLKKHPSLKGQN